MLFRVVVGFIRRCCAGGVLVVVQTFVYQGGQGGVQMPIFPLDCEEVKIQLFKFGELCRCIFFKKMFFVKRMRQSNPKEGLNQNHRTGVLKRGLKSNMAGSGHLLRPRDLWRKNTKDVKRLWKPS